MKKEKDEFADKDCDTCKGSGVKTLGYNGGLGGYTMCRCDCCHKNYNQRINET